MVRSAYNNKKWKERHLKKKNGCICSVNNDGRKRHKDETYCFMCWKKIHIVFYSDCYTCKN